MVRFDEVRKLDGLFRLGFKRYAGNGFQAGLCRSVNDNDRRPALL